MSTINRVLPRNHIHWNKGPTELKKVGHSRKYGAIVNFPFAFVIDFVLWCNKMLTGENDWCICETHISATRWPSSMISAFVFHFYTPVEDGTYYGITHGGRAASTSLSGAYLQNYSSYGYEISWVDRSHQGGVQCAGIITLASLIFQLLPFVFFSYLNFVRSISPKLL